MTARRVGAERGSRGGGRRSLLLFEFSFFKNKGGKKKKPYPRTGGPPPSPAWGPFLLAEGRGAAPGQAGMGREGRQKGAWATQKRSWKSVEGKERSCRMETNLRLCRLMP